jgi:hypothetical protein
MITVCVERLSECLEELKPLFEPHWQELALNQDKVPLDPQYEIYLARENLGEVLCVVARDAGTVVAYFVGFVCPGLHYRTCLTLTMDIFWIAPAYRETDSLGAIERDMLCTELFDQVKLEALQRGVQRVFYGSKVHKDTGKLFEAMGLVEVDRYYSAWWGG